MTNEPHRPREEGDSPTPRIVLDEKPDSNLRETISRPLNEYNESKAGKF